MRVNVYAEELSDRVEIIEKKTDDGTFTGLRIYLELPVTVLACNACGALEPTTTIKRLLTKDAAPVPMAKEQCLDSGDGVHRFRPRQLSGPFQHYAGDDDSSAVTFWGKRDLSDVLKKALAKLDTHYGVTRLLSLDLPEEDRQLVLCALAVLSLESPGFDDALNRIALRIDNEKEGRAELYDRFRDTRRPIDPHGV
jgi:hypothetical protein